MSAWKIDQVTQIAYADFNQLEQGIKLVTGTYLILTNPDFYAQNLS